MSTFKHLLHEIEEFVHAHEFERHIHILNEVDEVTSRNF